MSVCAQQVSIAVAQSAQKADLREKQLGTCLCFVLEGNPTFVLQEEAAAASHIRHSSSLGSHCDAWHCYHVSGNGLQCGHEQQAQQRTGGAAHSFQLRGNQRCAQGGNGANCLDVWAVVHLSDLSPSRSLNCRSFCGAVVELDASVAQLLFLSREFINVWTLIAWNNTVSWMTLTWQH